MLLKAADKAECESELTESSVSSESTIKPSDEILDIFKSLYTHTKYKNKWTKKKMKALIRKLDELFYGITKSLNATLNDRIALAYSYMFVCASYYALASPADIAEAKKYNLRSLEVIKNIEIDSKFILIALQSRHDLGSIHISQNNTKEAIEILHESVRLYEIYIQRIEKYGDPVDFKSIIMKLPLEGYLKLQQLYEFILNALLFVSNKIGREAAHNSIIYQHLLLEVRLCSLTEIRDCFLWVTEALILCNYLLKYDRFVEAKSHVTTALYVKEVIIDEIYNKTKEKGSDSVETYQYVNIEEVTLYLNMCRVHYGVTLLERSTERLLRLKKNGDVEINNLNLSHLTISDIPIFKKLLLFNEIGRNRQSPHKYKSIVVKYISDYNSAHETFNDILTHFQSVPRVSIQNVTIYMELILDVTKAYKYMAFYEKDRPSRILLQTQLIDFLSETINKDECQTQRDLLKLLQLHLTIGYTNLIEAKLE